MRTVAAGSKPKLLDLKTSLSNPAPAPVVIGTGLLTLDIVITSNARRAPRLYAGGTCGNVLSILSYLGWKAFPVARLNGDAASKHVLNDLTTWGVETRYATLSPSANTPIIVHEISRNAKGHPSHRFTWACPQCGAWLPSYQAITVSAARGVAAKIRQAHVFFMDRISRGALLLAEGIAKKGGLIVFEPVGVGDPKLFQEALRLTHILKYSHEKRSSFVGLINKVHQPFLEIETQGQAGLRYRSSLAYRSESQWCQKPSFNIPNLRDSAGAGDWCTAGIIHLLGRRGAKGLAAADSAHLETALDVGQAMAGWACGFEGAREAMYAVQKGTFRSGILNLVAASSPKRKAARSTPRSRTTLRRATRICPACEKRQSQASKMLR
jgi:sugar/nucleoside kinase (ribokinase family)